MPESGHAPRTQLLVSSACRYAFVQTYFTLLFVLFLCCSPCLHNLQTNPHPIQSIYTACKPIFPSWSVISVSSPIMQAFWFYQCNPIWISGDLLQTHYCTPCIRLWQKLPARLVAPAGNQIIQIDNIFSNCSKPPVLDTQNHFIKCIKNDTNHLLGIREKCIITLHTARKS